MHFVIVVVESSALRSFPCYLHLRLIEPEMHFLCMCGCEGSEERAVPGSRVEERQLLIDEIVRNEQ